MKYFVAALVLIATLFWVFSPVHAATILFPVGGGTGSSTLTGILIGNGTAPVQSLVVGSGLSLSGTTLTATGGGTGTVTQVNTTYPVLGGPFTTTGTLSLAFGTTTSNTWASTQTFSNTIAGSINGNALTATTLATPRAINGVNFDGSAAITITAASSTLLANSNTFAGTQTFSNAPVFSSLTGLLKGNGASALTVASNGTDYTLITAKTCTAGDFVSSVTAAGVFTCTTPSGATYTATYPVTLTGSAFGLAFGTTTSNTWAGTQTFTNPVVIGSLSGLIAGNSGTTYAAATSTLTASSPLTGSFTQIGSGGSLGCQTASGSQAGCLSSADWTTFNGKLSSAITTLGPTGQGQTGATQTLATSTGSFNGLTLGLTIVGSGNTQTFTPSITGTLGNAGLTNSTISGVALGGTLAALTATNGTLTFSGSYTGTAAQTVGLNLSNANTWAALQQFNANASTTQLTSTGSTYLATVSGSVGIGTTSPWAQLSVNPNGVTGPEFVIGSSTATHFIVTNAGKVGFGTATPVSPYEFVGASNASPNFSVANFKSTTGDVNLTFTSLGGNIAFLGQRNSGAAYFTGPNGFSIDAYSLTTSMIFANNNGTFCAGGVFAASTCSGAAIFAQPTTLNVGISSTTPFAKLSIDASSATWPLIIGSSTKSIFGITNFGGVVLSAVQPATTTTITLDWSATPQQVEYQIGTSATSITLINATTSQWYGSTKRVWICNPNAAAGAVTWAGVEWIGGTAPTQTLTANQCDLYSFDITRATSTTAYKVAGAASTGLQ